MFKRLKELISGSDINYTPQTAVRSLNEILSETLNNMVLVEGGSFIMGPQIKKGYDYDDGPAHKVSVSTFHISKYPVTQELWVAVMGENPSSHKGDYRLPVETISWYDCISFIEKLNKLAQLKDMEFRLPTEAEWEYAAHGGNKSLGYIYSGSNRLSDVAWYDCKNTHPVGLKQPNELGLYDMSGNVGEWCYDWYDTGYYSESLENNPTGPNTGSHNLKCIRGCCYGTDIKEYFQVRCRFGGGPDDHEDCTGLRLVLSEPRPTAVVAKKRSLQEILNSLINNMVYVEGGSFVMGDERYPDRELPHRVTLSSFYICKFQVTQEEWEAVLGNNPSEYKGESRNPVENVSWEECQEFIKRLNELTGFMFRMPTEAEWEYAARGGNKSHGYSYAGSNTLDEVAWYGRNSRSKPHLVGEKMPNELGLYDMTGNVEEWCSDWYDRNYYVISVENNPTGPVRGQDGINYKVYRGGNWICDRRIVSRSYAFMSYRHGMGLRLVMEVTSKEKDTNIKNGNVPNLSSNLKKLRDKLSGKNASTEDFLIAEDGTIIRSNN